MKAVVVLPTYNEIRNIKILIPKLRKVFRQIEGWEMHILVVDDNSPDGTGKVVKALMKKYKNVHLINGRKEGLGVAYLRGFKYAVDNLKADLLFEMDADLSHPPNLLPNMIKKIEEGYDLVIGSRYIKSGDTPNWSMVRRLISRTGNFFARIVSGMYKIHDCTSGFRAIKSSILNKVNSKYLNTRGYAFQITLLYEMMCAGAKAIEIPLVFYDRKFGETKLRSKDMVEFFFNSLRIRFKSSERMINFLLIGASGILINLGFFMLAMRLLSANFDSSLNYLVLASLIGDEVSIIYNFYLNNLLTFNRIAGKGKIMEHLTKFHWISMPTILTNNIILFILYMFFGMGIIISKLLGILAAFIMNYLFNTRYIWREKIENSS